MMKVLKVIFTFFLGFTIGYAWVVFYFAPKYGLNKDTSEPKLVEGINEFINNSKKDNSDDGWVYEDPLWVHANSVYAPILMYHHVKIPDTDANSVEINLDVPPENFEKQMAYMSQKGFQTMKLSDMVKSLKSGKQIPSRRFVITFDDGYDDNYLNALPILKRYNFKATFFPIVNFIDKPRYMTTDQIQELISDGHEIGSHTYSHANLASASEANAYYQLKESKEILEKNFAITVYSLCYPSGKYNDNVQYLAKKAGYLDAVTTLGGTTNSSYELYTLKRVRINGPDNLSLFQQKVNAGKK